MLRVLLVEDYPATARLIQTFLERGEEQEFQVVTTGSIAEVERVLLSESGFDAIVLDLGLPDSGGIDTLDQVLVLAPATAVIVLTGLDDESVALRAVQHGAQDFLIKGEFDSGQLKRSVRYAVERKRVFAELGASGVLLDGVLNSTRDAVMALEAVHADPEEHTSESGNIIDFRWRLANTACERVLGLHARELMAQRLLEKLPDAGSGGLFDALVAVVESGNTIDIEWPTRRHGQEVWLHIVAVKLSDGVAVTIADVTHRLRATRAIQAREERIRKIMETVADGIITIDQFGIVETFNHAAEQIFGYNAEEVLGRPVSLLMPPPHRNHHD
ncbi:MAG: PAS domain S-box protein, partial [Alphaproteobacteria bacterium]